MCGPSGWGTPPCCDGGYPSCSPTQRSCAPGRWCTGSGCRQHSCHQSQVLEWGGDQLEPVDGGSQTRPPGRHSMLPATNWGLEACGKHLHWSRKHQKKWHLWIAFPQKKTLCHSLCIFCVALIAVFIHCSLRANITLSYNWFLFLPGLTWRQIVTGLADDCSSLIGAVSRRPSGRLAATECVRHHLRSAANNPGQQSPDTSCPLLSWWVSSSELLFKGFPNTIQRYKARYPWKEISIF